MQIIKEDVDHWYSNGMYQRTRTVWLGGIAGSDEADAADPGIDWNSARRVIMALHLLDSTGTDKPITIIMNSCGGCWNYGMSIYDAIRACRNYVTIINMSHARSMSSIIFQAGDLRITAPSGYYMIHDGYLGAEDVPRSVITNVEYERDRTLPMMYQMYLDRLRETDHNGEPKVDMARAADIINAKLPQGAERVRASKGIKGITVNHIQQLCSRDTFFTPTEMIQLNLADRMLESGDLMGAYANPKMHGLPTGLASLQGDDADG